MTDKKQKQSKTVKVENLFISPLNVCGTEIPAGEAAKMELDQEHAVVKQWVAKKVIKVG